MLKYFILGYFTLSPLVVAQSKSNTFFRWREAANQILRVDTSLISITRNDKKVLKKLYLSKQDFFKIKPTTIQKEYSISLESLVNINERNKKRKDPYKYLNKFNVEYLLQGNGIIKNMLQDVIKQKFYPDLINIPTFPTRKELKQLNIKSIPLRHSWSKPGKILFHSLNNKYIDVDVQYTYINNRSIKINNQKNKLAKIQMNININSNVFKNRLMIQNRELKKIFGYINIILWWNVNLSLPHYQKYDQNIWVEYECKKDNLLEQVIKTCSKEEEVSKRFSKHYTIEPQYNKEIISKKIKVFKKNVYKYFKILNNKKVRDLFRLSTPQSNKILLSIKKNAFKRDFLMQSFFKKLNLFLQDLGYQHLFIIFDGSTVSEKYIYKKIKLISNYLKIPLKKISYKKKEASQFKDYISIQPYWSFNE